MKRLALSVVLLGTFLLGTIRTEEDFKDLIAQAEESTRFGSLDAKALITSLSAKAKKPIEGTTKGVIDQKVKACPSKSINTHQASGRCAVSLTPQKSRGENRANPGTGNHAQLLIFVSASMPLQSIKTLGEAAQKIGAHVVFRGLIGGTFEQTQSYMKDLGIVAEIDPTKFEDYQVTFVPAFILTHNKAHNKNFDRVAGHISLWEVLDQFKKKGELKADAKKLSQLLEHDSPQGGRS